MNAADLKPGNVLVAKDGWRCKVLNHWVSFECTHPDVPHKAYSKERLSDVQGWLDRSEVAVERAEDQ